MGSFSPAVAQFHSWTGQFSGRLDMYYFGRSQRERICNLARSSTLWIAAVQGCCAEWSTGVPARQRIAWNSMGKWYFTAWSRRQMGKFRLHSTRDPCFCNGSLLWNVQVNVQRINADGKVMKASNFGRQVSDSSSAAVELSEDEKAKQEIIRQVWKAILSAEVDDSTDFFAAGAGSMDVVRLVEELKDKIGVSLQNEDVFMATTFREFMQCVVAKLRGSGDGSGQIEYDAIVMNVNNMDIRFPRQMFVNGKFMDAASGKTTAIINPTDESVICHVSET